MAAERFKIRAIGNLESGRQMMSGNEFELEVARNVNEERLWERLMRLARIGESESGGVSRLALSNEETCARHLLIQWGAELGLTIYTDDISNLFFRLDGADPQAPPVMSGSHIDTQPNGGKFDGAFGVVAALEVLQAIRESGHATFRSVEAVVWLNEEGSRFAPGMMGSDVFTGRRNLADCLPVRDAEGISVAAALEKTQKSFRSVPRRPFGFPVSSFIEAHIEQGPRLEAANLSVGVVTGIQGSRRFRVRVTGEQAHAGTAAMVSRKDALFSATSMIQAMRRKLLAGQLDLKFTVGLFEIYPNAPSVVPSSAYFSVDVRHPDDAVLEDAGNLVRELCESNRGSCTVEVDEIAVSRSLEFPQEMQQCIRSCAELLGIPSMPIYSLAGHDARQLHYHCSTGMIFTPCHAGISHSDKESCLAGDLALATRVLAASVSNLANRRSS